MRKIVNISLPPELDKWLKKEVKAEGFASKSEFIRHLLRLWKSKKFKVKDQQGYEMIKGETGFAVKSLKNK